jgi:CPA1 family monovalent cation:H+ antiporter
MSGENIIVAIEVVILLLFIATLVGIVTRRLRFPYTTGLVLMGLALGLVSRTEMEISPQLILGILVPPLIFEAAFHIRVGDLRRDLVQILALAVPGVIITTFFVGGVVYWGTGFRFPVALVFGALVAATDPVAVVALFRSLGVPKRLQVLLESESLFNDGTAIVVFNLVVVIALTGQFSLASSLKDFIRVAGGGLVVGLVLGWLISQMIRRVDDHLIETTLTSVLAYGAYVGAESLHVSGVLAVVAAGLVSGNVGPQWMSATTRIVVFNFWEYAAFLANSIVFLLIGGQMNLLMLWRHWDLILWAILAVLAVRALSVYGLSLLRSDIPKGWYHVLFWGGLRGAISLALALSLPEAFGPARETLQVMAFGVVLFTLLIQGTTMNSLVRRLGLIQRSETQRFYELAHARAVAARGAYEHLQRMNHEGLISDHTWETLSPILKQRSLALAEVAREILHTDPNVEAEELDAAWREGLRAQRSVLNNLMMGGVISEETYSKLLLEVDAALSDRQPSWTGLLLPQLEGQPPIRYLITAVVPSQDANNVMAILSVLGFPITSYPSTGGYLGTQNVTLLIGLAEGQEEIIIQTLRSHCSRPVEYLPLPSGSQEVVDSPSASLPPSCATVFVMEVEHFEEF